MHDSFNVMGGVSSILVILPKNAAPNALKARATVAWDSAPGFKPPEPQRTEGSRYKA
jgi:hypothetical protein